MSNLPKRPIDAFTRPVRAFAAYRLSGALTLMAAGLIGVIWANSRYAREYLHLLDLEIAVVFGDEKISEHALHWINDGLMGIFFFLVGLEIKREVLAGELSTLRKAALPGVAAVGGMLVPALAYAWLNPTGDGSSGWGIPMATDIAFALGVLALLGDRCPLGLRVFLTALAIVDDIGAVLVIAIFYTDGIALTSLGIGATLWCLAVLFNVLHVRHPLAYLAVGLMMWLAFLESGVHATIATLLMAFTIPSRTNLDGARFLDTLTVHMNRLRELGLPNRLAMNTPAQQEVMSEMNHVIDHASAPLLRIEHAVTPVATFLVLPLFALANAGVTLDADASLAQAFAEPVTLGIVFGLFFGKQLGITAFAWLAVRLGLAELPQGVRFSQVWGVSILGGVGFTMALFIAGLAFPDRHMLDAAKLGILAASLLSGVFGYFVLRFTLREAGTT